jgi:hypothetical protein
MRNTQVYGAGQVPGSRGLAQGENPPFPGLRRLLLLAVLVASLTQGCESVATTPGSNRSVRIGAREIPTRQEGVWEFGQRISSPIAGSPGAAVADSPG